MVQSSIFFKQKCKLWFFFSITESQNRDLKIILFHPDMLLSLPLKQPIYEVYDYYIILICISVTSSLSLEQQVLGKFLY